MRAVGVWQRRLARKRGICVPRTGAITFVQRLGDLVNLNVHYHVLVPRRSAFELRARGGAYEHLDAQAAELAKVAGLGAVRGVCGRQEGGG